MNNVQELHADLSAEPRPDEGVRIQAGGYLLEMSLDWIVLRASENVHHLLGESHVTLIDEPLGSFVLAQTLHDLRNLFSRLSGTTGIARAYRVRLTDEREYFDIAFQLRDGRVLLEAVPTGEGGFGEAFGTVAGLISGLSYSRGQQLLDGAVRRMRALTGHDRVTLLCGDHQAESSRGAFGGPADLTQDVPVLIADTAAEPIAVFPRKSEETSVGAALMRAPGPATLEQLRAAGIASCLRVPFSSDGFSGEFRCDSRAPRAPSFEVAAAAELFAQLFAARLEIDQLKND